MLVRGEEAAQRQAARSGSSLGASPLATGTINRHLLKPLNESEENVSLEAIPVSPEAAHPAALLPSFPFSRGGS